MDHYTLRLLTSCKMSNMRYYNRDRLPTIASSTSHVDLPEVLRCRFDVLFTKRTSCKEQLVLLAQATDT